MCYLWRHTVLLLQSTPWRLVEGDIAANLRAFMLQPKPEDDTGGCLWECLNCGDEVFEEIVSAVRLFSRIPWSILSSEQGHGSMAAVRRYHSDFGANMMLARAFLHMAWALLNLWSTDLVERWSL